MRKSPIVSISGVAPCTSFSPLRSTRNSSEYGKPAMPEEMMTSPTICRPEFLSMSKNPVMTETTVTTIATHIATAAIAMNGISREVR